MFNNNLGLFLIFEYQGWLQAVDFTSQLFYQESKTIQVSVNHKEQLPVEVMIKKIFGKDAQIAIAVSLAENHSHQCDRIHVNNDKSVDIGVYQLNSVHFAKGYSVKDFADCKKNIEIAKLIFDKQGWTPWVAYTSGNYKKYLN